MKAVRCIEHQPRIVDLPAPQGPGVRVRVASAGICGSDLHLLDSPLLQATLGHEFAGWLDDGRTVAVEPLDPCWACTACNNGDYHRCVRGIAAVIGVGQDGGMAEQCLVPASAIVALPAGLAVSDACLIEPLAVAVHGIRRAGLQPRQRVAVIGAGPIGLCAVAVVRAHGVTVDLVARHDAQRAAGARLGAGSVAEAATENYDLVIEAAGTSEALARAIELARPGARVLLLGTYWGGLTVPGHALCMKEIELVPAAQYNRAGAVRDIDIAAALLAANPAIAGALITHRFPLDAAAEAFRVARDRASGAIKVVLEP